MEIDPDVVDHDAMGPPTNASGAMSVAGVLSVLTGIGDSIVDGGRNVRRRLGSVQQQDNSPSLFGSSLSGGEHEVLDVEEEQFPDGMERDSDVLDDEQQEEDSEGMEQGDVSNDEEQDEDDVASDDAGTWINSLKQAIVWTDGPLSEMKNRFAAAETAANVDGGVD